jgi:hypothetical protein
MNPTPCNQNQSSQVSFANEINGKYWELGHIDECNQGENVEKQADGDGAEELHEGFFCIQMYLSLTLVKVQNDQHKSNAAALCRYIHSKYPQNIIIVRFILLYFCMKNKEIDSFCYNINLPKVRHNAS